MERDTQHLPIQIPAASASDAYPTPQVGISKGDEAAGADRRRVNQVCINALHAHRSKAVMARRKKSPTFTNHDTILRLFLEYVPYHQIGKIIGVCGTAVHRYCKNVIGLKPRDRARLAGKGIPRGPYGSPQSRLVDARWNEVEAALNAGMSERKVAAMVGVTTTVIRKAIDRHGRKHRTPEEARRPWTPEERLRHSKKVRSGPNHPCYLGGKTLLCDTLRSITEYKLFRKAVLRRDRFECVLCGARQTDVFSPVTLYVDHVTPFSDIIEKHRITSVEDARQCAELWDVSNGRTLCRDCHFKTDTYGTRLLHARRLQQNISD